MPNSPENKGSTFVMNATASVEMVERLRSEIVKLEAEVDAHVISVNKARLDGDRLILRSLRDVETDLIELENACETASELFIDEHNSRLELESIVERMRFWLWTVGAIAMVNAIAGLSHVISATWF